MPAFSKHIDEEGILIAPQLVRRGNQVLHQELLRIFAQGERPARVPERNLADLHAQIASCVKGEALLQRAIQERGAEATLRVAKQARRNAAASVRGALRGLGEAGPRCGWTTACASASMCGPWAAATAAAKAKAARTLAARGVAGTPAARAGKPRCWWILRAARP